MDVHWLHWRLCTFTVYVSLEKALIQHKFYLKDDLERPFTGDTGEDSSMDSFKVSQYTNPCVSSFTWMMAVERLFITDTGEESPLHFCCSALPGDRALSGYDSFTWKTICQWHWGGLLCKFIVKASQVTELFWVAQVIVGRCWHCRGLSSVMVDRDYTVAVLII